jgi:hypothetical protein
MTKHGGALSLVLGVVLVAGLSSAAFAGPSVLGQVLTDDVLVDGIRVPAGTTLYSPSVVSTDAGSAVVQLAISQVLTIAENTTATIEQAEDGVAVAVQSGSVSFLDRAGRLQEHGEGSYRVEQAASRAPALGRNDDASFAADSQALDAPVRDGVLRPIDRRANVASRDGATDDRGEKWWWFASWWWNHGDDEEDDGGHSGHGGGHDDGGHGGGHDDGGHGGKGGHGHGKQSPTNP